VLLNSRKSLSLANNEQLQLAPTKHQQRLHHVPENDSNQHYTRRSRSGHLKQEFLPSQSKSMTSDLLPKLCYHYEEKD